jgi:hypothetical protein
MISGESGIDFQRIHSLKKILATVLILSFAAGGLFVSSRQKNADPRERLLQLYKAHRYFELHDALAEKKNDASPELDFFRAVAANTCNRLNEAIVGLLSYLQGGPTDTPRPLAKDAWINLADTYCRSGQYRKAGEAYRLILERFGAELDAAQKSNYENQAILWPALAGVPPQSVDVFKDSAIPMEKRSFPIRIKDKVIYVWYDTGASLSVLTESAAQDLGLALLGSGLKIQSATGKWIDSRVAVVSELRLGEAVVRNAVFLVLRDELLPVRQVRPGVERRGLIGMPILTALKEFIETKEGRLLIPAAPRPRSSRNMLFFGFKPIVEVLHRGDRLSLCVDIGSSATFLYPPFFRRYREDIESHSKLRNITMGTLGGSRTVAAHILDEFAFRLADRNVSLPKIIVHTEETHRESAYFDGVLGRDVLARCSRMIFNFESMSFILE